VEKWQVDKLEGEGIEEEKMVGAALGQGGALLFSLRLPPMAFYSHGSPRGGDHLGPPPPSGRRRAVACHTGCACFPS